MRSIPLEHSSVFFFNDTATTEIYTLSLHDALPISKSAPRIKLISLALVSLTLNVRPAFLANSFNSLTLNSSRISVNSSSRSEEHTSELQSRQYLVCRLLLEKKKKTNPNISKSNIYT